MKAIRLWHAFIALRIILTLRLQPGYIHPDEFFQSVEVLAGDLFGMQVHRTWEFNEDSPIRCMALPSVIYAPAYLILQVLAKLNWITLDTNTILLAPRVSILLLSLIMDHFVYHLLKLHRGLNIDSAMLVYSTSYISLVYYTRTLSNTLESFIFIMLLFLVQKEMKRILRHFKSYPRSKLTQCARTEDLQNFDVFEWIPSVHLFALGTCLAFGFFNRPTFLLFAYIPCLYYLFDGALPQTVTDFIAATKIATRKFYVLLLFCIPGVLLCVHSDTMYYKNIRRLVETHEFPFLEELPMVIYDLLFNVGLTKILAITPLNFIQYNTNPENLAEHGTHSRWTHIFVNQPMLFGTLFICVFFDAFLLVATKESMRRTSAIGQRDTRFWLHAFLAPLLLISIFPHQEPRFLIPLLVPLVVLYSHLIFGKQSQVLYKYSWILLNLLGVVFYGYMHQGGLIRSIDYMRQIAINNTDDTTIHVLYSHTYMPPKHLFMIKPSRFQPLDPTDDLFNYGSDSDSAITLFNDQYFIPQHEISVYDMQGKPVNELEEKISAIIRLRNKADQTDANTIKQRKHHIYVIAPSTLELSLCLNRSLTYQYKFVTQFSGHISMEEPPTSKFLQTWSDRGFPCSLCAKEAPCKLHPLHIVSPVMGLNVYRVYTPST